MNLELLHPRNRIAMIMDLIYKNGITTTSGGNISIKDEEGLKVPCLEIWLRSVQKKLIIWLKNS